ncbi:MAG: S8 family serine peptidase, partial [Prevotella sp.]|nr:S8 family serine peptidase [Prevotella sp.]
PDLVNNNYGTGYDAATNTTPAWVRGDHGTACTGIIGAQYNNAKGIAGVAPDSKLMSISIGLFYSDTPQQLANGFGWAWRNGADIISNSWGFIPGWWSYAPSAFLENAIDSALVYGRNGKGAIVVFASGNEDSTSIRYPGNFSSDILVVGAVSPCGERKSPTSCDGEYWWGSNYGTQLDVVAPGVLIPTTDRQGNNGYNYVTDDPDDPAYSDYSNKDYTGKFNGTSSACPHVAGVAALILSVNPTLTGQQVRDIIESTAQKVGDYNYQTTSGHPSGTWNNEMGYGMVNAYAAVQAACPTIVNFTNQTVTTDTTVTSCGDINVQNVTVTNGAKLTLDAAGEVNIISDFEVELGSEFEIIE